MEPLGYPKRRWQTTNLRCLKYQNNADLVNTAAKSKTTQHEIQLKERLLSVPCRLPRSWHLRPLDKKVFFFVAIRFPYRWTKEGVKQKITCYLIRKWRFQSIRPYIIRILAAYPSPNRFSHLLYPSLVKQTALWRCGWSRPISLHDSLHQSKNEPGVYVNILHFDCSQFPFTTAAKPLLSKTGLVKPFERACPNCPQTSKKSFRMPTGVLKNKIRSWSLPQFITNYCVIIVNACYSYIINE